MMIYEALEGLGVPVCHPPYMGSEDTYITYQILGQEGQIYAEGNEAETAVSYAVNIFAGAFSGALLEAVLTALREEGYIATVEMETYDKETAQTQISITATIEGAAYG